MENLIPGIVMAMREGLEVFLIIVILMRFLEKSGRGELRKNILYGAGLSTAFSIFLGLLLNYISQSMGSAAKIWESAASLAAVAIVATLIFWMINHGKNLKQHIEGQAGLKMSGWGIFLLSFILIAREGVEIAIFSFAGKYSPAAIGAGLGAAAVISLMVFFSLVRIPISTIFNITLIYLVIQAGYLAGYGIHEGLSSLKDMGIIGRDSFLFVKVFDLSQGILNHKAGPAGLPLNVLAGWYSKPEWIQFTIQYIFTFGTFAYWIRKNKKI